MNWLNNFDERQQKEIEFSILYLNQFEHGTDGHNAKVIIAKMAGMLNEIEDYISIMGGNESKNTEGIVRHIIGVFDSESWINKKGE